MAVRHRWRDFVTGTGGQPRMEIDHLFMFVDPQGPQIAALEQAGLVETYRRDHPGQGTANVCYAFDNLYLELLWVTDEREVRSPPIRRAGLYERSRWAVDGTSRFGIAWRETPGGTAFGLPVWDYTPPYLPPGLAIPVSVDSDDPRQPLLFRSPGTAAPSAWPPAQRGELQRGAGFGPVDEIMLVVPASVPIGPGLRRLTDGTVLTVRQEDRGSATARLKIRKTDGSGHTVIDLPEGQFT